jgi:hypothetical protein
MSDENERPVTSAGSVGEVLAKGIADIIRIATEPDWIPVPERLPAMGQQVLVVALGRVITATRRDGWWRHEIDTGTQTFSLGVCTPTYWMPLPAPPETST